MSGSTQVAATQGIRRIYKPDFAVSTDLLEALYQLLTDAPDREPNESAQGNLLSGDARVRNVS